jgi:hypothetical protein
MTSLTLTNKTTVTVQSSSTGNNSTGYVVVEFQREVVTQVQQISTTLTTGNSSDTVAVSPNVDFNRSVLFWGGQRCGSSIFADMLYSAALTDGATLTFTRNGTNSTSKVINVTLVEFAHGVLRGIQRGSNVLASANNVSSTIPSSDIDYGWCHQLGFYVSGTAWPSSTPSTVYFDAKTIRTTLNTAGTSTASWEAAWLN